MMKLGDLLLVILILTPSLASAQESDKKDTWDWEWHLEGAGQTNYGYASKLQKMDPKPPGGGWLELDVQYYRSDYLSPLASDPTRYRYIGGAGLGVHARAGGPESILAPYAAAWFSNFQNGWPVGAHVQASVAYSAHSLSIANTVDPEVWLSLTRNFYQGKDVTSKGPTAFGVSVQGVVIDRISRASTPEARDVFSGANATAQGHFYFHPGAESGPLHFFSEIRLGGAYEVGDYVVVSQPTTDVVAAAKHAIGYNLFGETNDPKGYAAFHLAGNVISARAVIFFNGWWSLQGEHRILSSSHAFSATSDIVSLRYQH